MGRSGHYYRMTLASYGGRSRVVRLLSMDRDGIVSIMIYRRRQGKWVYHNENHRDISDMIYLGPYYHMGEHDHDHYEDHYDHDQYDHNHRLIYSQFNPYIETTQVDNEQFSLQNDWRQPEFRKYVGNFVSATVEGLLSKQTRIFIHRSTVDNQGRERVTIVYPVDAGGSCVANATTVNAERISVILSY